MRTICCLVAVLMCGVSFAAKRKPAPLTTAEVEYPLSCNAKAKPLVLEGWNALSNGRPEDAREQLRLALRADPHCVMARATLGLLGEGWQLDVAAKMADQLGAFERLHLQVLAASRAGSPQKAFLLAQRLQRRAPRVMMANLTAAQTALAAEKWNEAAAAATAATELTPMTGAGWYLLGEAKLHAGLVEEARTAFLKYAEVAPGEANAHDALGDALLASGEVDAAGTSYQRAIDRSKGRHWRAWRGIANVMALSGDWTAARAAIATHRAAATAPADQLESDVMLAWSYAAQGRMTEALRTASATRAAPLLRGELLLATGRNTEALAAFAALQGRRLSSVNRARALAGLSVAQSRLGKTEAAANTLRSLERMGTDPSVADQRSYARGALALAQNAPRRALDSLRECSEPFDACRLSFIEALEAAGEASEALEARAALAGANHRDPRYWLIHSQLTAAGGVASERVPNPPAR